MTGIKQLLLILAVVALVGCGEKEAPEPQAQMQEEWEGEVEEDTTPKTEPKAEVKKPLTKEESAKVIEVAIREAAKKPTGELTKADLEKVTYLNLKDNMLTEVPKGLEKLTQLERLTLDYNKLTDVKGLEKLTQLKELHLYDNQLTDVTGLEKLAKLKELHLAFNKLTDVKGLEKLDQLKWLNLLYNPDLTKAQIAELQKALPRCKILSNPTK